MSTLKVGTIQDHANSNTAISIDSAGQVNLPNTTMIQQWQLLSNFSSNDTVFTDWGESTITSQANAKAGSAMTVSSGVFTFPKTGLYRVVFNMMAQTGSSAQDNYIVVQMRLSTDSGINFTIIKHIISGGAANMASGNHGDMLVNITNTSTHKVDFRTSSISSGSFILGSSASSHAHSTATFERLTDAQS